MHIRFLFFLLLLPLLAGGCKKNTPLAPTELNGVLKIHVDYVKQPGPGSNQWAVWIEDDEGQIIKTLFVTRFTADGGYIPRPSCVPLWVSKAHPDNLSQEAIDAFSGATPLSGTQTYPWDLTDADGNRVDAGTYMLMIEATLYGESEVVYKTPVAVGFTEWTLHPEPFYSSDDEKNKDMIRSVHVEYLLINDTMQ